MLDRQKLEAILTRRFPDAPRDQLAAAANAIMGLAKEPDAGLRVSPLKRDESHRLHRRTT